MSLTTQIDLPGGHREGMARVKQLLGVIGVQLVKDVGDWLDRNKVTMDGTLKNALEAHVDQVNETLLRLTMGSSAKHADWIYYGTKPHWPPPQAIRYWVKRKLGISEEVQIRRVAFLIARKISQQGTKAVKYLDEAFNKALEGLAVRVQTAYLEGLQAGM